MTGVGNLTGPACALVGLGVAELVVVLAFFRSYRRSAGGLSASDALGYVEVVLFLCVLAHAADSVSPGRPPWVPAAVLTAALVPAALWDRRAVRLGAGAGPARGPAAGGRSVVGEMSLRYERLKARVVAMEDAFGRRAWIHESGLAVGQLDRLLALCEPSPAGGAPAGQAPAAEGQFRADAAGRSA